MFSMLFSLPSVLLIIYYSFGACDVKLNQRTHPCTIMKNNISLIFDCQARHLEFVPPPINYSDTSAVLLLLSNNHLHTIKKTAFQKWANLSILDLSFNSKVSSVLIIDDEAFANQTKLKQLHIDNNNLNLIPPGLPISLRTLSLQYNNILSVSCESLSKITHLKKLCLDHNCYYGNKCSHKLQIQEGAFLQLEKLTTLSLSCNNLRKVPSRLPSSLKVLNLKNNVISIIRKEDFMNLSNLKILNLSGNCPRCFNAQFSCKSCPGQSSIRIYSNAFKYLKKLVELNLGNTSLTLVQRAWFQNLKGLKVLNLENNYLVKQMATGDFMLSLSYLQKLDLSYNYEIRTYSQNLNLSENFSKLISLQELHLQGYVFQTITNITLAPLHKIKNLNVINFGTNFIRQVNLSVFHNFHNLSMIYLSENRITPFIVRKNENENLEINPKLYRCSIHDIATHNRFDKSIDYPLENNRWSDQIIKPICISYGKTLDLSYNTMFFIDAEEFNLLSDIVCLNLSHNSIDQDLNGTEFIHMPNLTYLDLSYNKLDFDSSSAFQELPRLQVLDLSYNAKYFLVEGVTHNLNFIGNLPSLKVFNISWNKISTLTEYQINNSGLEELRFSGNSLNILWRHWNPPYKEIFKNFSSLKILDISYNDLEILHHKAVVNLPKNITELHLNYNKLTLWEWKTLQHFKNLKFLDLSHNRLIAIESNLFMYTSSLQKLRLHRNLISQLSDSFLYKATSLTDLDLTDNHIQTINKSAFLSGNDNFLKVLRLKGNPFVCTCEIIDFLQWIANNNVTIPLLATDVTCSNSDFKRRKSIIQFDMHACSLDGISMMLCFLSFISVVLIMALRILKHLFYWDVWYIYHWCVAKLKPRKMAITETLYDAFITYDNKDPAVSDWVYNELCHELEENGDKHIFLCLEEREWEPGKAVIDNIAQSINQSKKTVFVLTKKYVKSGKFRTAFYLAMQKLMDENMDVIVIVLLQPVLQNSQYLRLRKKICSSSILEWPKNPHAEHLFWQNMKNVLLTENSSRYNHLYTNPVTTWQHA
ncbi:LOW QUALITY PROTEIN: toll-like receptor 8 [Rhinoderma darwinii]|uniref:LOW QUALITY PROTEIN: toll-like receptor 8 n=1 Tax=Rhinoderma darwinii TaxID=43563 RepID=UPI003F66B79D